MGLTFEVSTARRDPSWDDLLDSIANSHFEQTSGWGAVKSHYGWQILRIVARDGERPVGGMQVLTREIRRLGTIAYVSRGPVALPGFDPVEELLVAELDRIGRDNRWLYCVFDYPYQSHELAAHMRARGYFAHPAGIPPSSLLAATVLVDLCADEETILSRMNRSFRRKIRRSQRSGLVFAEGGLADLPKFRELMTATCARRQTAPTPPQKDFFELLWAELSPRGLVRLFLVRYEDEVVCASFSFTVSDTLRSWKVGWSGTHADKDPNHFMRWEMIRWAKSRGMRSLDLVWVDTEDAKRAARGDVTPEGFKDGSTYFKLGFGGKLLFTPPVQSKFFNPMIRLAYRFGGSRILASNTFQRAVARYWSGAAGQ